MLYILREKDDLEEYWDEQKDLFISRCDELLEKGSGWTLKKIIYLRININKYTPLSGNSYVELPKWIKDKKACVNVKNNDNKCFMYSVISCLRQAKEHVDRLNHYNKPEYINELNFEGIHFPVKIQDIPKFESHNKINVTVFSYDLRRTNILSFVS
jgi:hypothetical protein